MNHEVRDEIGMLIVGLLCLYGAYSLVRDVIRVF